MDNKPISNLTQPACRCGWFWMRRTTGFCGVTLLSFLLATGETAQGQLRQRIPGSQNRQWLDLELDQQRAQSNIAENRVTRQAEISRLEGRLLEIESRLDRLATPASAATGLAMIGLFDQLASVPTDSAETATSAEPNKSDDVWTAARPEMLRLIAEDYIQTLEIQLASARIDRMKLMDNFRTLQQMRAKGLASQPQLDLKELEYKQAMLRVDRLEKLTKGYRELLPQAMSNTPAENDTQPPSETPLPSKTP